MNLDMNKVETKLRSERNDYVTPCKRGTSTQAKDET